MLVNAKYLLRKAQHGRYAIGAFNVYNLESVQAVIRAAEKLRSPVIIQTSESAVHYAGLEMLVDMIKTAAMQAKIPVVLHLDHGRDISLLKRCLKLGYTSVMIDGSLLTYEKNIALTKKVVALARKHGTSVEAELGVLGGREDLVHGPNEFTDPALAQDFVVKTGIDSLAISIGTSHGAYKPRAYRLRFDILKKIVKQVGIPLVLHGASMVDHELIISAKKAGISIKKAQGVRPQDIKKAIKLCISKVNVDTDLRIAFTTALRTFEKQHPQDFNPRDALAYAEKMTEQNVIKHIKLFGSAGKA